MLRDVLSRVFPERQGLIAPDVVNRWLLTTCLSIAGSVLFTVAKMVLGLMSASSFLFANGLYNLGVAASKALCLRGYLKGHDAEQRLGAEARLATERTAYRIVGVVAAVAGAVYTAHGVGMAFFDVGINVSYGQVEGISIATLAFTEIGLAIGGLVSVKAKGEPALSALKLTNMANSLVAMSLAQAALLSFSASDAPSIANGLGALFFGAGATAVGVFMVVHAPKAGTVRLARAKRKAKGPKSASAAADVSRTSS